MSKEQKANRRKRETQGTKKARPAIYVNWEEAVCDKRLTASERLILVRLDQIIGNKGKWKITTRSLARELGFDKSTVSKGIQSLIKAGWIVPSKKRKKRKAGFLRLSVRLERTPVQKKHTEFVRKNRTLQPHPIPPTKLISNKDFLKGKERQKAIQRLGENIKSLGLR